MSLRGCGKRWSLRGDQATLLTQLPHSVGIIWNTGDKAMRGDDQECTQSTIDPPIIWKCSDTKSHIVPTLDDISFIYKRVCYS